MIPPDRSAGNTGADGPAARLRRHLKERVRHPYITGQHLHPPGEPEALRPCGDPRPVHPPDALDEAEPPGDAGH